MHTMGANTFLESLNILMSVETFANRQLHHSGTRGIAYIRDVFPSEDGPADGNFLTLEFGGICGDFTDARLQGRDTRCM